MRGRQDLSARRRHRERLFRCQAGGLPNMNEDDVSSGSPDDTGEPLTVMETEKLQPALFILGAGLEEILEARRDDYTERERYQFMLLSVAHFLNDLEEPESFRPEHRRGGGARRYANDFIKPVRMLVDLDSGKLHPVLKPEKGSNGPPDTTADWLARADISLGVVAAQAAGKRNREEAAKYVAQRVGEAVERVRRPDKRGAERWKSVLNWYDTFSRKGAPPDVRSIRSQ